MEGLSRTRRSIQLWCSETVLVDSFNLQMKIYEGFLCVCVPCGDKKKLLWFVSVCLCEGSQGWKSNTKIFVIRQHLFSVLLSAIFFQLPWDLKSQRAASLTFSSQQQKSGRLNSDMIGWRGFPVKVNEKQMAGCKPMKRQRGAESKGSRLIKPDESRASYGCLSFL